MLHEREKTSESEFFFSLLARTQNSFKINRNQDLRFVPIKIFGYYDNISAFRCIKIDNACQVFHSVTRNARLGKIKPVFALRSNIDPIQSVSFVSWTILLNATSRSSAKEMTLF